MKTIYVNDTGTNKKIALDDRILDRVNRARNRVYDLGLEDDWSPTLEIEIEVGTIRVSTDSFKIMGEAEKVITLLAGDIPTSMVSAMIGNYGYEGWETILHRDLFDTPDLYFDRMFIYYLKESSKAWRCIEPEHRKTALAMLYRHIRQEIKYGYRNKQKLERLAELIKRVYKGRTFLDTLMRSINSSKLWI